MTVDVHLFYLLPLLSVFLGLAIHLWWNSNSQFFAYHRHLLYTPNLQIQESIGTIVQPILCLLRTVRRKLLRTGDSDEEVPSFVLLSSTEI